MQRRKEDITGAEPKTWIQPRITVIPAKAGIHVVTPDGLENIYPVIPAKAGIQRISCAWI